MNGPRYNGLDLTPTQVALELLGLSRQLADAVADLDAIEQAVVQADEAYVMADAEAHLVCRSMDDLPAADDRKAWCDKQTHAERLARETARAVVRARKLRIDTIKSRVSIGQTVANALQCELDLQRVRGR
jgi:hypothetical protein